MGNRAAIVFDTSTGPTTLHTAIYLHWNGGPESIYAFLDEFNASNSRGFDASYNPARFAQLVGTFIGGSLSLGIITGTMQSLAHSADDNGVYLVTGKGMRRFVRTGNYEKPGVRELTADEVATEERLARMHKYWEGDEMRLSIRAAQPVRNETA
jgi:hypothetical protein